MFSNATNVLCCRHSSRCSFAAILRLKPMKHDGRVGLGVVAKCLACAQMTLLLHLPCSDWLEEGGPCLNVPQREKWNIGQCYFANYFALHAETLSILREETNRSLKAFWSTTWSSHMKAAGMGHFKMHAPGIITVGIWGWQQGWSSTFIDDEEGGRIFLPLDPSNKHVVHCCPCARLPDSTPQLSPNSQTLNNKLPLVFPWNFKTWGREIKPFESSTQRTPVHPCLMGL